MYFGRRASGIVGIDLLDQIAKLRELAVNVADRVDSQAFRYPVLVRRRCALCEKPEHAHAIAKPATTVKRLLADPDAAYGRRMMLKAALLSGLIALLSDMAPGNPPPPRPAAMVSPDQLVTDIGYRLAAAGGDLCPSKAPVLGMAIQDLSQFDRRDRARAAKQFALGTAPQILAVAKGSAAARAGLRAGDALILVDGQAPPAQPGGGATFARISATLDLIEHAAADGRLDLVVQRADGEHQLTIPVAFGCSSRFIVSPSSKVNSEADGTYVAIDAGMVRFAGSEDQLAVIVAHELAHNILGHRARLEAWRDEEGDGESATEAAETRATENEADRLGVYLLDHAGYPPEEAAAFWRRYAEERQHRRRDSTHPAPLQRVATIEREIARLQWMKAQGEVPHPQFWPRPPGEERASGMPLGKLSSAEH